jgi:hypothetical protein
MREVPRHPATGVHVTTVELIVEHTRIHLPRAERGVASGTGASPVCVKIGRGETLLRNMDLPPSCKGGVTAYDAG